jgi:hypothetical protein
MIDADEAERNAVEQCFPRIAIRVCQFHLMQACRSRLSRVFGTSQEGNQRVQRPLQAIRQCQRCPNEQQWPVFFNRLGQSITAIAGDGGEAWVGIRRYLEHEWFSRRWLPSAVDFGLPSHVTRDGPWSTNNYSEAAFKTFDRVFLNCRANKRQVV